MRDPKRSAPRRKNVRPKKSVEAQKLDLYMKLVVTCDKGRYRKSHDGRGYDFMGFIFAYYG